MAAQGDREDKKLVIQRSQLRQHGEFWHVSVSERQKLRVPFLRTVLPPEVGESARAMASTTRQKRSYLHHQGEFQLQNCTVGTVHDSDHEGVVRIFVRHSYHSNELFTLYYIILHYAAQFSLYQECNYVLLLSDRLSAHAYKHENGVTNEAIVIEWAAAAAW